jgi:hypothetical protein
LANDPDSIMISISARCASLAPRRIALLVDRYAALSLDLLTTLLLLVPARHG